MGAICSIGCVAARGSSAWYRPGRPAPAPSEDISWQAVDLLDRRTVDQAIALDTPSRIYHLAGAPQVDASWQTVVPHLEANVLGTHHLLDAVRRLGRPCRLLVVTSAQVYRARSDRPITEDDPFGPANPYGLSKLAQDELARRAVIDDLMDVVIARPFNHAGPRQNPAAFGLVLRAADRRKPKGARARPRCASGNVDVRRDIIDVRDVVGAYERLMEGAPAGRAFNVASGHAERIGDLLDRLTALARVPVRIVVDPTRLRPSDVPIITGDASRLRAELGWTPTIPIAQTLADTLAWWRAHLETRASDPR